MQKVGSSMGIHVNGRNRNTRACPVANKRYMKWNYFFINALYRVYTVRGEKSLNRISVAPQLELDCGIYILLDGLRARNIR